MFERMSRGWGLCKQSWAVLRKDKELVMFPILSSIACILLICSFAAPVLLMPDVLQTVLQHAKGQNRDVGAKIIGFLITFAFYFLNYFIVVYFNVALVSCAIIRFRGGDPTVGDGLRTATSRLPQILAWSLVAATVGMILRTLEERVQLLGKFVVGLIGLAWSIAVYFVVPVLAVERVGPIDAVKRSSQLLAKTWGESLAGNLSLGGIGFLLCLPGIAVMIGGVVICGLMNSFWVGGPVALLGLVYLVLLGVVMSTLHQIFLAAVYIYAAEGAEVGGFSEATMRSAFRHK